MIHRDGKSRAYLRGDFRAAVSQFQGDFSVSRIASWLPFQTRPKLLVAKKWVPKRKGILMEPRHNATWHRILRTGLFWTWKLRMWWPHKLQIKSFRSVRARTYKVRSRKMLPPSLSCLVRTRKIYPRNLCKIWRVYRPNRIRIWIIRNSIKDKRKSSSLNRQQRLPRSLRKKTKAWNLQRMKVNRGSASGGIQWSWWTGMGILPKLCGRKVRKMERRNQWHILQPKTGTHNMIYLLMGTDMKIRVLFTPLYQK